jgi:PAS domain S-box-containing protein
MNSSQERLDKLQRENKELQRRLQEAEETLSAIRTGEVDALVVDGPGGEQVFSLTGVDHSYRVLVEEMNEGAMTVSEEGLILYANRFMEQLLDTPLEKITGSFLRSFIAPGDLAVFQSLMEPGRGENRAAELQMKAGGKRELPVYLSICRLSLVQQTLFCLSVTDLSLQKRNELVLAEERLSRSIIEQSAEAIIVCDNEGAIVRASWATFDLVGRICLGMVLDQALTIRLLSEPATAREEVEYTPFSVHEVIRGTQYHSREALTENSQSQGHHVLLSAARLLDRENRVMGCVVNLVDITERRQAEQEHRKMQRQLAQASKMESIGKLAGGVAHDFNNMLNVILGYGEMILEQTGPDDQLHEYAREIVNAGTRSTGIVRQLLAYASKQIIRPKVIDVNENVENTLKMLRRLIGEDIHLTWHPTSVWPVSIDPAQLDQILTNICANARDAIEGSGKITIETGTAVFDEAGCREHPEAIPGDYLLLSLQDNGRGIAADRIKNIFEPFYSTKEMGSGTGLGLATVYGIVKQNKGFINVESMPGKGTTFSIYLPRYGEDGLIGGKLEDWSTGSSQGEKVLVVEDNFSILRLTTRMLQSLGYIVISTASPLEALRLVRDSDEKFDLLVTDIIMPQMNGRELSEKILELQPAMKCLFMSGYTSDIISHQGALHTAANFIQKPFTKKSLAAKVRTVLDGASEQSVHWG